MIWSDLKSNINNGEAETRSQRVKWKSIQSKINIHKLQLSWAQYFSLFFLSLPKFGRSKITFLPTLGQIIYPQASTYHGNERIQTTGVVLEVRRNNYLPKTKSEL